MGGGKSSSSSSSSTETNSSQQSTDGVITGIVLQGQEVNLTQSFSQEVADAFNKLIEQSNKALDLAAEAGGRALDISSQSVDKVSQRYETQEQPTLGLVEKLVPIGLIAVAGIAAYYAFRK